MYLIIKLLPYLLCPLSRDATTAHGLTVWCGWCLFPTMSMFSFCLDLCSPLGDAPGASLGRDAFACASPAAFLRLPVPGNGRAPGGRGPYTGLCGGLPKARRVGALSPARPGRGCKVLPFGSLASLAPVVVRTYWYCRCHLGRVRVV